MNFGEWLRTRRQQRGYSQEALGRLSGKSGAYISMLERGYNTTGRSDIRPSLETIDSLARALEAPIAEARVIAGYCAPESTISTRTVRAVALFEALPEEFQDMVIDQLFLLAERFGKEAGAKAAEATMAVRRTAAKKAATRRVAANRRTERLHPDMFIKNNLDEVDHIEPARRSSKKRA